MYLKKIRKMDKLRISDIMTISRPIVFLCGPYYVERIPDRRFILFKYLKENLKETFPLIIDKILDPQNISGRGLEVQLLEEIFAQIASETLIFLDTLSAATELGLFVNNSSSNKITVFEPYGRNLISRKIGYFISQNVFNENSSKINVIKYIPTIERVMKSTNNFDENIHFIENEIPTKIVEHLDKINPKSARLVLFKRDILTSEFAQINYYTIEEKKVTKVNLSISTLMYLVLSILDYNKEHNENENLDVFDIEHTLNKIIENTIFDIDKAKVYELQYNFILNRDIKTLIMHIVQFKELIYMFGAIGNKELIKSYRQFLNDDLFNQSIHKVIGLTDNDLDYLDSYLLNSDSYIKKINVYNRNKIRKLITYNDDYSSRLRVIHKKVSLFLNSIHYFSNFSFAYKKNSSILDAVSVHTDSRCFWKIDIKKFFPSISKITFYEKLIILLEEEYYLNTKDKELLKKIVNSLTYNNEFSLGLITSPIVSEIFLSDLDRIIEKFIIDKNIKYSRYADDMLFSHFEMIPISDLTGIIKNYLAENGLELNDEKTRYQKLINKGDHFKFLGLNYVLEDEIRITVGKKYLKSVAKNYVKRIKGLNNGKYFVMKNLGQLNFIKDVCGETEKDYFKNVLVPMYTKTIKE